MSSEIETNEREFIEILVRYCKGIRASTQRPKVAQQAAIYEAFLQDCLDNGVSPRKEDANAE